MWGRPCTSQRRQVDSCDLARQVEVWFQRFYSFTDGQPQALMPFEHGPYGRRRRVVSGVVGAGNHVLLGCRDDCTSSESLFVEGSSRFKRIAILIPLFDDELEIFDPITIPITEIVTAR